MRTASIGSICSCNCRPGRDAHGVTRCRSPLRNDADGFEQAKMSPAELTAFVQSELAKWRPLAKKLMAADRDK